MIQGSVCLTASSHVVAGATLAGVAAVVSGVALLAGFLTPVAGGLVALGAICIRFSWIPMPDMNQFETRLMTPFVAVVAAAIILLGPGALSLDARLFGRREIIIPRAPHSPNS